MLTVDSVDKLTEASKSEYLKQLIERLDELDNEDFFGTEGWRHFLGIED